MVRENGGNAKSLSKILVPSYPLPAPLTSKLAHLATRHHNSSRKAAIRLTQRTYPGSRPVHYNAFTTSAARNDAPSRLTSITHSRSSGAIESYLYLGLSTVIQRTQDETGMKLTYLQQISEPTADAGHPCTGLNRFGRIIDQRWINASGAVDRYW